MEWKEWIGKIVFIKLDDGQIFSFSTVLAYEEPFLSITDRDGLPAIVNFKTILKIKEEMKDDERRY
ncbi:MAG: hypothetical protein ACTSPI_17340 [Candidatus Heimdallarchaeaceae archaeon]